MFAQIINITQESLMSVNSVMTDDNGTLITGLNFESIDIEGYIIDGHCLTYPFFLYSVIVGIICVFGFMGAILSFAILHFKLNGIPPVANFLLRILSLSDSVFIVLWFIHYSIRYTIYYAGMPASSILLCLRVGTFPLLFMAQSFGAWTVVIIALNRYLAVCLPYRAIGFSTLKNFQRFVAIALVVSVISNLPRYGEIVIQRDADGQLTWNRTALYKNKYYTIIYTDFTYYLTSFFLPLLLLLVLNTRVIVVYRASRKKRNEIKGVKDQRKSNDDDNISHVMIVVMLVFMTCQAPAKLSQLLWNYYISHCRDMPIRFYLIHLSNALEALNSSANVILYFVFYPRFRCAVYRCFNRRHPLDLGLDVRDASRQTAKSRGRSLPFLDVTPEASSRRAFLVDDRSVDNRTEAGTKSNFLTVPQTRTRSCSLDVSTPGTSVYDGHLLVVEDVEKRLAAVKLNS